jgi:hypothetical protein
MDIHRLPNRNVMRVQCPSYRFDGAKLRFKPDDCPGSRSIFSDSL